MKQIVKGANALSILSSLDARISGTAIAEHLQKIAALEALPDSGWFAGQSVATAFEELFLGAGEPRYNDVDHFLEEDEEDNGSNVALALSAGHEVSESYGQLNVGINVRYWVRRSERQGMLNRIVVRFPSSVNGSAPYRGSIVRGRDVIASFDLNSVQIGIDLASKELFWTPDYEEFISTRQLEVVRMHTPAHTAIRVMKKLEEHPQVWCDLPRVMKSLAGLIHLVRQMEAGEAGSAEYCRTLFGEELAQTVWLFYARLSPYFDLEETTRQINKDQGDCCEERTYYTLRPKVLPAKELLSAAKWVGAVGYPEVARLLLTPAKPLMRSKIDALFAIDDRGEPGSLAVIQAICGLRRAIDSASTVAELRKVRRFIGQHPMMGPWLAAVSTSWSELVVVIERLKRHIKNQGMEFIGILESVAAPRRMDGDFEARYQKMESTAAEQRALLSKTVRRRALVKRSTFDGVAVRELVSRLDLLREGTELHHCVGGYAGALHDDKNVLLSLRGDGLDSKTWSTAHLLFTTRFSVHVLQHVGLLNEDPPSANRYALKAACEAIIRAKVMRYCGIPSVTLGRMFDGIEIRLKARWKAFVQSRRRSAPKGDPFLTEIPF